MIMFGTLVALLLAFYFRSDSSPISFELLTKLHEYGAFESASALTFVAEGADDGKFRPIAQSVEEGRADTTAVLLNWSRLENVILLVSLLCGHWLDTVIANIVVWNNNPQTMLTVKTFAETGCSSKKLHIFNSEENLLFQARFMACANADTIYCFFQDDDYLVQPQIIRNVHDFAVGKSVQSIHLLPSHEHLLSNIRTFHALEGPLETTFAWLGHGTLANRTSVQQFLDLIGQNALKLTTEERRMADNYFTVLSNHDRREDLWLDHGIELGGGQPFTVGQAGDNRNNLHIAKALAYLNQIITADDRGATLGNGYSDTTVLERPGQQVMRRISRTPCRLTSCVLSTNIALLPGQYEEALDTNIAALKVRNSEVVDAAHRATYIEHPLSNAVDGRSGTSFISIEDVQVGDWIALHHIFPFSQQKGYAIEIALLVDEGTARMLQDRCSVQPFNTSHQDFLPTASLPFICIEITPLSYADTEERLNECSARFSAPEAEPQIIFNPPQDGEEGNTRYGKWRVYEIWLRLAAQ